MISSTVLIMSPKSSSSAGGAPGAGAASATEADIAMSRGLAGGTFMGAAFFGAAVMEDPRRARRLVFCGRKVGGKISSFESRTRSSIFRANGIASLESSLQTEYLWREVGGAG